MMTVPGWRDMTEEELVAALIAAKLYKGGAARYVAKTLKRGPENRESNAK